MEKNNIGHVIWDWVSSIIVAVVVGMIIHIFIFQPTKVSGESMENTLHNGDYLGIIKWEHILRMEPNYEDIVVIDSRVKRERTWKDDAIEPLMNYVAFFNKHLVSHNVWVKRVIGKPGDVLEFHDGHVWRNGKKLEETYVKEPMNYTRTVPVVVPENHVFVMGDNRNHSSDSRFIGPVPLSHVLGKKVFSL